jgi:hypothetical protein
VEWSGSRGSPPRVGRLYGYWQLPGASGSPARANSSAVTLARPRRPCSGSFRCGLPVSTPPRPETGRLAAAQFANAPVSGWMTPALGRPRQPRQGGTAPCRRTSSSTTSRPGGCRAPTAPRGPHGQASLPASATASSIPPSRSWTGPRSVRSAPPPSWLVDAASLEEAVTLAKGCRASRSAVVSRLASSASQRVSGSADLRVLEDTVKRDQRVFDAQARSGDSRCHRPRGPSRSQPSGASSRAPGPNG